MEKILLAVDGSEYSDRALVKAKEIGTALNAEITILYVIEDIASFPYVSRGIDISSLREVFNEQGKKVLNAALELFKDYAGKVETLTKTGNPGGEILKVADEGDYTLIILGSKGMGVISRAILGSVSNKVVNNAKTSVLIAR